MMYHVPFHSINTVFCHGYKTVDADIILLTVDHVPPRLIATLRRSEGNIWLVTTERGNAVLVEHFPKAVTGNIELAADFPCGHTFFMVPLNKCLLRVAAVSVPNALGRRVLVGVGRSEVGAKRLVGFELAVTNRALNTGTFKVGEGLL